MKRSSGNGERLDDVRRMALIQRIAIIATTVIVVICCVVVRLKRHEKQEIERQRMEATYPGLYDTDSPELFSPEEYPSLPDAESQSNGDSQDAGARVEKRNYNQYVIDKHASKPKPGSGDHGYWEDHEDWEEEEGYGDYEDWEDYYDDNEEDILYDY